MMQLLQTLKSIRVKSNSLLTTSSLDVVIFIIKIREEKSSARTKLFGIKVDKISIEKQNADLYYDPLKINDKCVYRYCLNINLLNSDKKNKTKNYIWPNPP